MPVIDAADVRIPVRGAEARESGDEDDAAARLDRRRDLFALGGRVEDRRGRHEPLERGAADEHRAFGGVLAPAPGATGGSGLQEPSATGLAERTDIRQDEASRPVRRLGLAGDEAALAEQRGLLVADERCERDGRAEQRGLADDIRRRDDARQQRAVD